MLNVMIIRHNLNINFNKCIFISGVFDISCVGGHLKRIDIAIIVYSTFNTYTLIES